MPEPSKNLRPQPMVDPMFRGHTPAYMKPTPKLSGRKQRLERSAAVRRPKLDTAEVFKEARTPTEPEPQTETSNEPADSWSSVAHMRLDDVGDSETSAKPLVVKKKFPASLSRKKKTLLAIALVLLVGGSGGFFAWRVTHAPKPVQKAQTEAPMEETPAPTPEPATIPSPLSGLPVSPEDAKLPLIGVMIENSPEARPQSGLKDAGIVYEAVAEGGITRFLAMYQEGKPAKIGPIRSARPYYLDWLLPYDAGYAHVGGSTEALAQIKVLNIKDLDEFANGGAYYRATDRYAPHNVYTTMDRLRPLMAKKSYTASTFTALTRKTEQPAASSSTAKKISLNISSLYFNVTYDYEPGCNCYKRNEGGKTHTDANDSQQLAPKSVLAVVMPRSLHSDGIHTVYDTVGTGTLTLFQDGIATQGTWEKPERNKPFVFRDSTGKPLEFNPGQLWITMVQESKSITYTL